MTINISPRKAAMFLFGAIGLLLILHAASLISMFGFGHGRLMGLVWLFNFAGEHNVPALFSALLLLTAACVLACITIDAHRRRDPFRRHWLAAAMIFVFLACDEAIIIHELLAAPMREMYETNGVFHFAWIIPYGLAVLLLALMYRRFVFNLPRDVRNLIILAAALYVGGAIGLEMIEGWYIDAYGVDDLTFRVMIAIEELMEMSGAALFIYALLRYVDRHLGGLTIVVKSDPLAARRSTHRA